MDSPMKFNVNTYCSDRDKKLILSSLSSTPCPKYNKDNDLAKKRSRARLSRRKIGLKKDFEQKIRQKATKQISLLKNRYNEQMQLIEHKRREQIQSWKKVNLISPNFSESKNFFSNIINKEKIFNKNNYIEKNNKEKNWDEKKIKKNFEENLKKQIKKNHEEKKQNNIDKIDVLLSSRGMTNTERSHLWNEKDIYKQSEPDYQQIGKLFF